MGCALMLAHLGARKTADKMYSFNTQNKLMMLEQCHELEEANQLADEILVQNKEFFAPYSVKAQYCYAAGDFGAMIQYEKEALARNPFQYSEYEAYCKMLMVGISLYEQEGDRQSADFCKQELLAVSKQLQENIQRLSTFGKMIKDQPTTVLSEEVRRFIEQNGGRAG